MNRRSIYTLTNATGAIVRNGMDVGWLDTLEHCKKVSGAQGPCTSGGPCKVPPTPPPLPPMVPISPKYPSNEFWIEYWQRKRQAGWKSKKEQKADEWKAAIEKKRKIMK